MVPEIVQSIYLAIGVGVIDKVAEAVMVGSGVGGRVTVSRKGVSRISVFSSELLVVAKMGGVTTQLPLIPRPLLPAASLLEKGRNAVESPSPRRFAYGEGLPLRFR